MNLRFSAALAMTLLFADSTFATECRVYFPKESRTYQCQDCEESFDQKAIYTLNQLGYSVTQNKNDRFDFILQTKSKIGGTRPIHPTKVQVVAELINTTTGQKRITTGITYGTDVATEDQAMVKALSSLPACLSKAND